MLHCSGLVGAGLKGWGLPSAYQAAPSLAGGLSFHVSCSKLVSDRLPLSVSLQKVKFTFGDANERGRFQGTLGKLSGAGGRCAPKSGNPRAELLGVQYLCGGRTELPRCGRFSHPG